MNDICPVCSNRSLIPGEQVDIGVGMIQCGPDRCETCGYIEAGPDPHDKPIEHYKYCWKNGIDPNPEPPKMIRSPLRPEHKEWIQANVQGDGYGQCYETAQSMAKAFPELRVVYGTYECYTWGSRSHFWCVDSEFHVVDPTETQFPSCGFGSYVMSYFFEEEDEKGLKPFDSLDETL